MLAFCLHHRYVVIGAALALTGATVYPMSRLGSEFMPPLAEGDLLFMPITVPASRSRRLAACSAGKTRRSTRCPRSSASSGKAGRAGTSLDPAALSMFETVRRW